MLKPANAFKTFMVHLGVIGIIYLSFVALFDNKNTMIVTMDTEPSRSVEAEFYYTKKGLPFSDEKMSRRYKIKGNRYYFRLPPLDEITYARLDPAKQMFKIFIHKDIYLVSSKWFRTSVYLIDATKSEAGDDIADYQVNDQGILFVTTGKDPYLNINLTRTLQYTAHNMHLDSFLFALLAYAVLLFLLKRYKKKPLNEFLSAKLILYALFLSLALFKVNYYKEHVHYTYPPDTIAHMSYVKSMHEHPELLPKFEDMYMITNPNAGNYLGHPPLYYMLMNTVYDKHLSVVGNMDNFRTLNTVLFLAGMLLMFYIGFQAQMGILGHFVYLTVLSAIPMHAYLGGSLTNDNLANLGGIIFIIGLLKLLKGEYSTKTYLIVGLGIFIAYFSKLTAALLVFFGILFYLIYLLWQKIPFKITKFQIGLLSLFIIPVIIYQIYIFTHYHVLIPTLNATHPEEYKHSVYYIPEALRHYQNLWEWAHNYWHNIHSGWFGIHSHHSLVKTSIYEYFGLLMLHIFAIIALFIPCKEEQKTFCLLGKITLLSLFSVMVVQFTFSYLAHLHSGYTGGLQVRYLLPFMVSFAIMASIFVDRFSKQFVVSIIIIVLSIHAIYSDFFYFLTYYL